MVTILTHQILFKKIKNKKILFLLKDNYSAIIKVGDFHKKKYTLCQCYFNNNYFSFY